MCNLGKWLAQKEGQTQIFRHLCSEYNVKNDPTSLLHIEAWPFLLSLEASSKSLWYLGYHKTMWNRVFGILVMSFHNLHIGCFHIKFQRHKRFFLDTINNIFCWSKIRECNLETSEESINEMLSTFFGVPLVDKEFRHDFSSVVILVRNAE